MKHKPYYTVLIVLILTLQFGNVFAQWKPTNGPTGGWVTDIVRHNNKVFALNINSGPYRSINGGNNWVLIRGNISDCAFTDIYSYKNTLFVCTSIGLFRSENDGDSWSKTDSGVALQTKSSISSIYKCGDFLFLMTEKEGDPIYRSTDDGKSWKSVAGLLPPKLRAKALISNDTVLLLGSLNGIFASTDFGNSWNERNAGLPSKSVYKLFRIYNKLYVALNNYSLHCTSNSGITWLPEGHGFDAAYSMAAGDNGAYISTGMSGPPDPEIWYSADSCKTWDLIQNTLPGSIQFHSLCTWGDTVIGGLGQGLFYDHKDIGYIYRSTNHGVSWEVIDNGLSGTATSVLQHYNGIIIAGTLSGYIFKSSDGGMSWAEASNGITLPQGYTPNSITSSAASATTLFVSSSSTCYRSTNGGNQWHLSLQYRGVNELLNYHDTIYASTTDGIFNSTDMGVTWESVGFKGESISSIYLTSGMMLVSKAAGIFLTTDNGINWQKQHNNLSFNFADFDGAIYGCNSTILKSTDNGRNWDPVNIGLDIGKITSITADSIVLIAIGSKGIAYLRAGNKIWHLFNEGLIVPNIYSMLITDSVLYCGTSVNGVWKRNYSDLDLTKEPPTFTAQQPNFTGSTLRFDINGNDYTASFFSNHDGSVRLFLYDLLGNKVKILSENLPVEKDGITNFPIHAADMPNGMYFLVADSDEGRITCKAYINK